VGNGHSGVRRATIVPSTSNSDFGMGNLGKRIPLRDDSKMSLGSSDKLEESVQQGDMTGAPDVDSMETCSVANPEGDKVMRECISSLAGLYHEYTIVMFADIVGFTTLASTISAQVLVRYLDVLFSRYDQACMHFDVEKVKTIGDCYMCVTWGEDLETAAVSAQDMLKVANEFHRIISWAPLNGQTLAVRVGMHIGPAVSGIIGRTKFAFDIWGDTVNVASRMESTGVAGATQVTPEIYELLQGDAVWQPQGYVNVKGKGRIQTWITVWNQPDNDTVCELERAETETIEETAPRSVPSGIAEVAAISRGRAMNPLNSGSASRHSVGVSPTGDVACDLRECAQSSPALGPRQASNMLGPRQASNMLGPRQTSAVLGPRQNSSFGPRQQSAYLPDDFDDDSLSNITHKGKTRVLPLTSILSALNRK
jgi:class 3 adenylate cyclase